MRTRRLQLAWQQPYDVDWVLGFLARRAIPGIETVNGRVYERVCETGRVRIEFGRDGVGVTLPLGVDRDDGARRVSALLDLDADSSVIDARLAADPDMASRIRLRPGLRIPGAWDAYELTVRAILGQQVSVDRATKLAGALVARYGDGGDAGGFPSPERLERENPAELGLPGRRGEAIRRVAAAVSNGTLPRTQVSPAVVRSVLAAIPGIGPWTAEYVAMRAGRDPDAFPASDWVVRRELGATAAGAARRAERWRPYRAYAVMYLWAAAARRKETG